MSYSIWGTLFVQSFTSFIFSPTMIKNVSYRSSHFSPDDDGRPESDQKIIVPYLDNLMLVLYNIHHFSVMNTLVLDQGIH